MSTPGQSPALPRVSARSFTRIPTVMTAQEIVDSAFRRASRITVPNADAFQRMRQTETARIRSAQNNMVSTLTGYVKRFPSFDGLGMFYQDLIGILVDMDRVRKALGTIDWAAKRITEIGDEAVSRIRAARYGEQVLEAKGHAYGRMASIMNQVNAHLVLLDETRRDLRRLPFIDYLVPTIVVAGFPNVGKSSLVRRVSTGTPEVANYPFTTKGIVLGHFEHKYVKHQIVDTPGLLDRDLASRNDIERQAIAALAHIGDIIVFLVDSSEHCGYPLEAQLKLLEDVKVMFPNTPLLVAESKSDLAKKGVGEVAFSAESGEGVEDLMKLVFTRMRPRPAPE